MVAADRLAHLAHRRPAELAAPDDQRVVEQSALFQVRDQGRMPADRPRGQTRSRPVVRFSAAAAVVVPVGVVELHEADAALHQPTGQQTVVRERWLARLGAVQLQRLLRLPWRCRSAPGRWSASGRPSRRRRCAWRSPDRRCRPGAAAFRSLTRVEHLALPAGPTALSGCSGSGSARRCRGRERPDRWSAGKPLP